MIRRKAMFKVILIITALCLGTPSEAVDTCIWCNPVLLQNFMDCCTQRMANNPNFKTCESSMKEMKTDLLEAAKAMKNNGSTKENALKGAMAFQIASCISRTDGDPDKKISDTRTIFEQCYQTCNIYPDEVYINEALKIMKDKLEEKVNPSNVQQPKIETQSDKIPQTGQNINPSQNNNYPPQQAAADPNQEQNQWNVPYGKLQQEGQNFQPLSTANTYPIPYEKFQKQPGLTNNGYFGNPNQDQPFKPLYTDNQWNPYAYQKANQKYLSNTANSNPGGSADPVFYRYYEPQSNKRYIPSYAGSSASAAYYDPYDYSPNNPASNQKPSLSNIYKRKQKWKPTGSPQIKPDSYDDKSPDTWQLQNQKKQPNTNDNSDQSPDDKAISYDKLIKNKAYKKDDQSFVNDKTDYSGYDDKNQPPNYKPVNIKQKSTDTDDDSYEGSYDCDDDYFDCYDDKDDGEDDSWNSNGGDSKLNPRDDLDFSKKKQNPGTWKFQNQKKQLNSDQSPDYEPISNDRPIKNKTDKKDDQSYVGDNYPQANGGGGNNTSKDYLGLSEKKQALTNDSNVNDKSSKDIFKEKSEILSLKNASKNNKQEDKYPDIFNVSGDYLKIIPKSKELERQKNKLTPQYLPEFDKNGSQKLTTPMTYITDDQQTSTPPDIDQKNSTAPIIPNTLKGNDKKTVLNTGAPVLLPNISDNSQKLDLKKANHSESDDRVKILMKEALNCKEKGKFDYNTYSGVIVALVKFCQQNHPDWGKQKCQTTVLIEAIFGLSQLLLKSNIKEVKGVIQQPQKIVEPVELPPNSQQNNQNVPQKNHNPNYQSGQANENSQPLMQDKPAVDYSAPEQIIAYPPQNKKLQNKWNNNQNSYPFKQSAPIRQPNYANTNPTPPQSNPTAIQNAAQVNSWEIGDQNNLQGINNNPGFRQNRNQGRWSNAQSRATASSSATQNAAQGNNWNTGNQEGQNNLPQRNSNNANSPLFGKQPGQVNTNQGNGKWGDKAFSILQTVNSNVGVPDINPLQYPLGYQTNWPGLQQKEVNSPIFPQNGVQGSWDPTPNGPNNPSLLRNGNPRFIVPQDNGAPIPNGPSNPSFMQNGYQSRNQGIRIVSQADNSPQRYPWNRRW